jgi:hypothetical protein
MQTNATNPFDDAAAAVAYAEAQSAAAAQPDVQGVDLSVSAYPTLAKYPPASHNTVLNDAVSPALDVHAREAVELMADAAILRAHAVIERDQLDAELARRLT